MDRSQLIAELSAALVEEIEELKSEGQFQLAIYDGRLERESGGKYEYYFRLDRIGEFTDDVPISVKVNEKASRGSVLSVGGLDLFLALDDNIGESVPMATLESAPYFLLETALEKLPELPDATLPRRLFGIDPLPDLLRRATASLATSKGGPPNDRQRAAIEAAAGSEVMFLWGPPGTGKTTTIAWIVEALRAQQLRCLILANTNVATDKALLDTVSLLSETADVKDGKFVRWGPMRADHPMSDRVDIDRIAERLGANLKRRIDLLNEEAAAASVESQRIEPLLPVLEQIANASQRLQQKTATVRGHESKLADLTIEIAQAKSEVDHLTQQIADAHGMSRLRRFISRVDLDGMTRRLESLGRTMQNAEQQQLKLTVEYKRWKGEAQSVKDSLRGYRGQLAAAGLSESELATRLSQLKKRNGAILVEKAGLEAELREIRKSVLGRAVVVGTTLARCYSAEEMFAQSFDAVIIDEASMAPLPMVFIDSHLAKRKVIVIGDFKQLSPIAKSRGASAERWLKRNIFELQGFDSVVEAGETAKGMVQLVEQYRMHPDISALANTFVYGNSLIDAEGVQQRGWEWRDREPGAGLHVALFDSSEINPWCGRTRGLSRFNIYSALIAASLVKEAKASGLGNQDIAVITPYRAQADLIAKCLEDEFGDWAHLRGLGISTVHRFQGHERQLVIFDITDGPPYRPGLLLDDREEGGDDERLLNVAVTRAQGRLILLGNVKYVTGLHGRTSLVRRVVEYIAKEVGQRPAQPWMRALPNERWHRQLSGDLSNAHEEIVFVAPNPAPVWETSLSVIREALERGVSVRVLTSDTRRLSGLPDGVRAMRIASGDGYRVNPAEVLTIIDKRIAWIGAGPLTTPSNDLVLRLLGPRTAEEILRIYGVSKMVALTGILDNLELANQRFTAKCEDCGSRAQIKRARQGRFFVSCSGYPRCTWSRFLTDDDIIATREPPECPQKHGPLEIKRSFKNQSFFWGCHQYPECRETRSAFG